MNSIWVPCKRTKGEHFGQRKVFGFAPNLICFCALAQPLYAWAAFLHAPSAIVISTLMAIKLSQVSR